MYKIGELAALSQIPVKTLRYYDEIGILRPAHVERSTGYRYYEAAQLEQINRILVLKDLGLSLGEIRALIADNVQPRELRELLELKRQQLQRRVERENARLARAAARLELLDRSGLAAAHDVAVREVGPQRVCSVRDTLASYDECARLFEELDRHLRGRRSPRRRAVIWHSCREGAIDCEALELLPKGTGLARSRGRVGTSVLPAHRAVSLVYRGENFMPAYRAVRVWSAAAGAKIAGPKRELFLVEGDRDVESITELQIPIAAQLFS